ncbi:hypothetical protein MN608_11858 [Microdochium nivale]|nr:hypothetical protein MN608_11858 [Microdochium nivale]
MKKKTTRQGASTVRKVAEEQWAACWRDLPQAQIQAWIERIPVHIQQILKLEGGNEYVEGRRIREDLLTNSWGGRRLRGHKAEDRTVWDNTAADDAEWVYDVADDADDIGDTLSRMSLAYLLGG